MAQEVAMVGSWIWHIDEGRMEWSDQMYKIFGIGKNGFVSIYDTTIKEVVHPDDFQVLLMTNLAMVRNKLPEPTEFRINRSDGTQRILWLQAGELLCDENGEAKSMSGIVQDITERKRVEEEIRRLNAELEQRVRDRTTELEATNQQLEAFSYSVSHDLRAPLRAINGFANILAETQEGKLNEEGQHALDVINSEALRMGKLIDDLLLFSRFGRQALRKQEFDHGAVVRDIFAELIEQHPAYNVELILSSLPTAPADPGLLRQVWLNLMQNALKFTRRREHAVITVSGSIENGEAVYHIRDNGAGFDMQFADKLFGVFQRLHRVDEYEGTGVGLALVQRVIHRHGGRVWAEGAVDEGATFSFSLPIAQTDDTVSKPSDC
jgi:PAS domain S-box-containing protein